MMAYMERRTQMSEHTADYDADYPEHWVRKPWPEERFPTVDEWIDWFLTAPRDQQYAEVAMSLRDTERAIRCLMLHPQPTSVTSPAEKGQADA